MADPFNPATATDSRAEIYQQLRQITLIDPHTHINPHSPASETLADVLGYHYYTELAHSAGMDHAAIQGPGSGGHGDSGKDPRRLVESLVKNLGPLENTAQYSWLIDICRTFFGFEHDRLTTDNWETLYQSSERTMASAQWPQQVLEKSNVSAVFLTNDFDDELEEFDSSVYIPCLRTDDLVFHLAKPEVRARLQGVSKISIDTLSGLRSALRQRFIHFVRRGARACAISLPPGFIPTRVSDGRAQVALAAVLKGDMGASPANRDALSRRVFWTLAELCDEFGLPFDLMIGVNRGVYEGGVHQGQDLYDSRVSLIQYKALFNAFPSVTFPISVLASVTNQELVSYAWIFPNVVTNGHWWYSNTPSMIARDAAHRLEAVPQTKQIGYYSDAYKLEFVHPKFDMYRRVLAGVLADQFVAGRGWGVERAVELCRRVLRDNVERIFPEVKLPAGLAEETPSEIAEDVVVVPGKNLASKDEGISTTTTGVVAAGAVATAAAVGAVAAVAMSGEDGDESKKDESLDSVDDESVAVADVKSPEPVSSGEVEQVDDFGGFELIDEPPTEASTGQPDDDLDFGFAKDKSSAGAVSKDDLDFEGSIDFDEAGAELPIGGSDKLLTSEAPAAIADVGQDPIADLDSLPADDQIDELEIIDVEVTSGSDDDDPSLGVDLDPEPLDVGDLGGGDLDFDLSEIDDDPPKSKIKPMTGDGGFVADSDSLKLKPDPVTGEPVFNPPADDGDELLLEPLDEDDESSS